MLDLKNMFRMSNVFASCQWRDRVLPIHKEVLEAYLNERDCREDSADKQSSRGQNCSVEFDGTITEAIACDPSGRVVVARWSIDLMDRISIKLLGATLFCPEPSHDPWSVDPALEEVEAFTNHPEFGIA